MTNFRYDENKKGRKHAAGVKITKYGKAKRIVTNGKRNEDIVNNESWFNGIPYHWATASLPLAYAAACVEVVLGSSEKAREIYEKIIDTWGKQGIKVQGEKIFKRVPGSEKVRLKEIAIHPEIGFSPDPDKPFEQLESIFSDLSNDKKIKQIYKKLKLSKNKKDSEELFESARLVCDFIIFGFNKESDIRKDKCKILPNFEYPWLILAIMIRSLYEHYGITMEKLKNIYKVKKYKDKVIDFDKLKIEQPTNRLIRRIIANSKAMKLKLHNDKIFINAARAWYQSRVVYGSVEKYCDAELMRGIMLDPKNVDKQIRPCDEAVGYIRRKIK
jgi:hypothetical protein